MAKSKLKILLVDDHKMVRQGLASLLNSEDDFEVVAEASDGKEAVKLAAKNKVDVIIMDIALPKMNGIEATKAICEKNKNARILAVTMNDEYNYVKNILKAGANGYILKHTEKNELIEAIKAVASGKQYFSAEILVHLTSHLTENEANDKSSQDHSKNVLTKREKEVLRYIAMEYTNAEIAEKLSLSVRTIDTHKRNILRKLNARNVVGLVHYAIENNLI